MEKQLENPTQNQDKPTRKPNPKSIKTHQETQPKNSPNPPKNPAQTIGKLTWNAQRSRICCSIYCHCCRPICYHRVFHCCRRIFHCRCRLGVEGKGSVAEERGRAKAKGRPNQLMVEAAATASWIGKLGVSWIGELGRQVESEWGKEKRVSELKKENRMRERENGWGKERNGYY